MPDPSDEASLPPSLDGKTVAWDESATGLTRARLGRELRTRVFQESELPLLVSARGAPWLYTAEVALVAPQEYEWARVVRPGAAAPVRILEVNGRQVQSTDGRVPVGFLVHGNNWLTFQLDGAVESSKRPVLLVRRHGDGRLALPGAAQWRPTLPTAETLDHEVGRAITAEPESPLVREAAGHVDPARQAAPGSWEAAFEIGLGFWSLNPKCRDVAQALGREAVQATGRVPTRGPFQALPADSGARSVTALLCLDAALASNPTAVEVWSALAKIYFESCRFSDAVRLLAFLCSQPPEFPPGTTGRTGWLLLPLALNGLAQASPSEAEAVDLLTERTLVTSEIEADWDLSLLLRRLESARQPRSRARGAATTEAYLDSLRLLPGNREVLRELRARRATRARSGSGAGSR